LKIKEKGGKIQLLFVEKFTMLPIVPIINVPMPTFCQLFVGYFARPAHLAYWGNHPRAVCILEKHREKLNTWLDACQVST
jgi:hypothetical protein